MRYSLALGASPWAVLPVAAVVAGWLWHSAAGRRDGALLTLRAAAAASLALLMLRPTVAYRDPVLRKPRLAVLIDDGHSMASEADGRTRLRAALGWLERHRADIEARAEPVYYALSGRARRLGSFEDALRLGVSDAGFHAAEAMRDVADDWPQEAPSRAWLLSDGAAEPSSDLDAAVEALRTPVDSIGVGPERRGRDLSFAEIKTPDFAFLHGRFDVQAAIEASDLAGVPLALRLLKEQRDGSWAAVQDVRATASADYETVTASFTALAQALGPERYKVEARALAGPPLARSREFRVEVIRQKYRIMYLAGRPSAEYAQLREFLKSDPNHELVSFVILRNPENPTMVADNELSLIPFPAEEIFVQDLYQFDLFILENFSYARFRLPPAYLESLKAFVASGGALLIIGGENAFSVGGYRGSALEEMLPVTLSGTYPDFVNGLFSPRPAAPAHPLVRLYDAPQESEAAWSALPPLDGWARFGSVRPGATVLAIHPQEKTSDGSLLPVLAARDYGRGKVLLVSSDSTWRWKLGAASDWRIGSFYARFWSRAVQYLTGSLDVSKVKFAPLPDRLPAREPATFSLRVFDEAFRPAEKAATEVSVFWTSPDGRTKEVPAQETEPGVYAVCLTGLSAGGHRLRAQAKLHGRPWGEDAVRFQWEPAQGALPMDRRWLKKVSDQSGGAFVELGKAKAADLLDRLPAVRRESEVSRRYRPWLSPWWLWLTAALLIGEWGWRRWKGHA